MIILYTQTLQNGEAISEYCTQMAAESCKFTPLAAADLPIQPNRKGYHEHNMSLQMCHATTDPYVLGSLLLACITIRCEN